MIIDKAICAAIKNKDVVRFTYSGTIRKVEPHLLGYDADGDLTLSAWQLVGTGIGWRDFHVSKIVGLTTTGQTFLRARSGYNHNDQTLVRIVCRL